MKEELKKEGEIATPEEPQEPEIKANEKEGEEPDDSKKAEKPLQIDYKAELEAEKARAKEEGFKEGAAYAAKKKRDKKRDEPDEEPDEDLDEEDQPLTAKQLDQILTRREQSQEKVRLADTITKEVSAMTDNEDERELIIEVHKNRTFPKGMSIQEQLQEAYLIANKNKILAKTEEMKRALNSSPNSFESTYRDGEPVAEPKVSSQDAGALKASGFSWDGKQQLYKKPLKGGKKHLFYNPKTKKRWVQ